MEYCNTKNVDITELSTYYKSLNLESNLTVQKESVSVEEQKASDEIVSNFFKPLKTAT